ncbi:MAG: IS1595 family transposase, partial [Nitrospiraceae bacterium]
QPETLQDAVLYFADEERCVEFVARLRWPDGVHCPRCKSTTVTWIAARRLWQCKGCRNQFSVKVGTIFEASPIRLSTWLPAVWLIASAKNGISSYELARLLGVTQKSAWLMLHRIRFAMRNGGIEQLSGEVEADEGFIGAKTCLMHKCERKAKGRGAVGKAVVMALLERHGDGWLTHVPDNRAETVQPIVRERVQPGSELLTDGLTSYAGLDDEYVHQVIDRAEASVRDNVHTSGIESFCILLMRMIKLVNINVEPFNLFRNLDELAFRFNTRKQPDAVRMADVVAAAERRRLTNKQLIRESAAAT